MTDDEPTQPQREFRTDQILDNIKRQLAEIDQEKAVARASADARLRQNQGDQRTQGHENDKPTKYTP